MNRVSLIMGGTFLVVAATLAVTITTPTLPRESTDGVAAQRRAPVRLPITPRVDGQSALPINSPGAQPGVPQRGSDLAALSTPSSQEPRQDTAPSPGSSSQTPRHPTADSGPKDAKPGRFSIGIQQDHPAAASLAPMARQVEAHANRNLERLTQQLGLTPAQREKLFPILARSSESYDPAMMILDAESAAPALSADAGDLALQAVLSSEQQEERIDIAIDDSLLWQEIISGLELQLIKQSPQILQDDSTNGDVAPAESSPNEVPEVPSEPESAPPASSPRGNLFKIK